MAKPFKHHACWKWDDESENKVFLRATALQGDAVTFAAVHSPISNFEVEEGAGLADARTEQALLDDLCQTRAHAIVLVEGEPGSGKSHLIRWLEVEWPKKRRKRDHVVMVPRSDGDLLGTLDRLREKLGAAYGKPLENLGGTSVLNIAGQAQRFLSTLATYSNASNFQSGADLPDEADFLETHQVSRLLGALANYDQWQAPGQIVKHILAGTETDDQSTEQQLKTFTANHIVDLVECIERLELVLPPKPTKLVEKLKEERHEILGLRSDPDQSEKDRQRLLKDAAPMTVQLVNALNARIEFCVQGALHLTKGQLQKKFLEVRKLLKADNKRLVLLLEDITNFQGLDKELVEALLPRSDDQSQSDVCELVAVVGLTPAYAVELRTLGNIKQRLHLHIRLTSSLGEVGKHSTLFLDEATTRNQFVATYLNAVRVGHTEMASWHDARPKEDRPNHCGECKYQEDCHAAFGAVEVENVDGPVGLYPLTEDAVTRFWEQLRERRGNEAMKTPRGLLQHVVSPLLNQRDDVRQGRFPGTWLEDREASRLDIPGLGAGVRQSLSDLFTSDREQHDRLKRTVIWWGNKDARSETPNAEVPPGVFDAFGLLWPGVGGVSSGKKKGGAPEPPPPPPPTTTSDGLPEEWQQRIDNLNKWADGSAELQENTLWESKLRPLLGGIRDVHRPLGQPRWLWEKILSERMVVFEGKGASGQGESLYELPKAEPVVQRGLTALVHLDHGNNDRETKFNYVEDVVDFHEWLSGELWTHVERLQKKMTSRLTGTPVDVAARTLVLDGLLQGYAVDFSKPTDVWSQSLSGKSDTQEKRAHPEGLWARVVSVQSHTNANIVRENNLLFKLGGVGQYSESKINTIALDGAAVRQAVDELLTRPTVWKKPTEKERFVGGGYKDLKSLWELVALYAGKELVAAVEDEYNNAFQTAGVLAAHTEGDPARDLVDDLRELKKNLQKKAQDLLGHRVLEDFNSWLGCRREPGESFDETLRKFQTFAKKKRKPTADEQFKALVPVDRAMVAHWSDGVGKGMALVGEAKKKVGEWKQSAKKVGQEQIEETVKRLTTVADALGQHTTGGR